MTIYDRIKYLRERYGYSQAELSEKVGYRGKSTISKIESGQRDISQSMIQRFASVFGVSPTYLIYGEETERTVRVPVYGRIAAGIPISAITDIEDYEEISAALAEQGEYLALKIHGDSMEPRIREGDVIIIRRQEDCESGDVVAVLINGDEATCKRIKKTPEGIYLISNNPAYDPLYFTNKQINELPVRLIGKVVELRAKF